MGELLAESMSLLKLQTENAESMDTEIYAVKGGPKANVHVVAGQKHRRDATRGELLDMLKDGSRFRTTT
jgi:hypothetical protein